MITERDVRGLRVYIPADHRHKAKIVLVTDETKHHLGLAMPSPVGLIIRGLVKWCVGHVAEEENNFHG